MPMRNIGFSIHPEQGDLIYLLCRAMGARRVVEFATSIGMSTLYFAAAIRDNGGGKVIGSDIVPGKLAAARRNLAAAGLAAWVDLRPGDARETLRDLGGPVDVALIDGWPGGEGPSLARQMMEIIAPQLRIGGIVINDNAEPDYLDYIRDPANGFRSMSLPLKGGTELSVKLSEPARAGSSRRRPPGTSPSRPPRLTIVNNQPYSFESDRCSRSRRGRVWSRSRSTGRPAASPAGRRITACGAGAMSSCSASPSGRI